MRTLSAVLMTILICVVAPLAAIVGTILAISVSLATSFSETVKALRETWRA